MTNKITIGSVESFTGGAFATSIVSIPNASRVFKGSLITYSNEIKEKLGIDISRGVINKDVAIQMALKGKEWLGVDYCFAFTGNAGPSSMESKNVGLVYIAINDEVYELNFQGNRSEIINLAVKFAMEKLKDILGINFINSKSF